MEATQADIARLVHRQEITDRLVDYCRQLDEMDLEALVQNFTQDCRVTYGDDPHLSAMGRAGLQASLARMWRWRRTAHHLCNLRIWFEGARRATATSDVWAWHEAPDGACAEVYGTYQDTLIRTKAGWLIDTREMRMRGANANFRVPIPPARRHDPPPGWTPPEGLAA